MFRALCVTLWCLSMTNGTLAQLNEQFKFSLSLSEQSPMTEVLHTLEQEYLLEFAYDVDPVDAGSIPAGEYQDHTLPGLLNSLLPETGMMCEFVQPRKVLLRRCSAPLDALDTIVQTILDAQGMPIANAAVYVIGKHHGTTSAADGTFQLPVTANSDTLIISHLAYAPLVLTIADARHTHIVLQRVAYPFDEVAVIGKLPVVLTAHPDYQDALGIQTINQGNGVFGYDILRYVQLLPGVSSHQDNSAGLQIRGSNTDETLIILDDIPIYRADHFYGIFGAINGNYVHSVNLHKNAMPVEFGGRTGGLVTMRSLDTPSSWNGVAEVNLLSSSLSVAGPVSPGLQVSAGARTSFGNIGRSKLFGSTDAYMTPQNNPLKDFDRENFVRSSPDFEFSDFNGRIQFQPTPAHRLSLSFYRSSDHFDNTFSNAFQSGPLGDRRSFSERFAQSENWETTGASLVTAHDLSDLWSLKSLFYFSEYTLDGRTEVNLIRNQQGEISELSYKAGQSNLVRDISGQVSAEHQNGQLGIGVLHHQLAYHVSSNNSTLLTGAPEATEAYMFSNVRMSPAKDLSIDAGVRLTYYSATRRAHLSPRIHATYTPQPHLKFKGAFGLQHQFIRQVQHENRFGQSIGIFITADGEEYQSGRSYLSMIGANLFVGDWTFDVELFYKSMHNVIDHAATKPGFGGNIFPNQSDPFKIYTGSGRSAGMDLFIKRETNRYSTWLAYTLSRNTRMFDEVFKGQTFSAQDDRRHQMKWINAWRLGDWTIEGNVIWSSGRPYFDLRALSDLRDRDQLDPELLIRHLPAYARIDISTKYQFSVAGQEASVGASVFNLLDRSNVDYLQYLFAINSGTSNIPVGAETRLLRRTANIHLAVRF